MKLVLDRKWCKDTYSIGNLYIDGVKFCNTLEDKDRGLNSSMSTTEIISKKVKSKTAIPKGTYEVTLNGVSPRFGSKQPRLLGVKGFDGVLIHAGNTAADTDGCISVGENKAGGKVLNSKVTYNNLYAKLKSAADKGEQITITIQ